MKELIESIMNSLNESDKCESPECRISYYKDIQHLMLKLDGEIRKNILKAHQDVYKEWADTQMRNRVRG
jgi:hypothetical protein